MKFKSGQVRSMDSAKYATQHKRICVLDSQDSAEFCFNISPNRTVIVYQGDVSDVHHLQGVVGDFNAVRIQDVSVFLSPPS